ncbi:flippase [Limosilactobacillus pontis]|uniref:Flippase n=1 Tax=Limosilactobacillus pontis TaxID=35787 RepID=A0ABT7UW32_9LACO|nr:flippase [Limosilactobacillus pontis]MDM8265911.1 flippase [Limosilactobacillus pontis]
MKVIKNYLYNAGYQILLMFAPLITTPYVSRVLGAHNTGINEYTNSWVTFFYLVGQLGITLYGNREIAYHRDDLYERSKTFWEIESLQACTMTLTLIAYLGAVFVFSTTYKEYFLLQTLWICATAFDVSWFFMGLEDFRKTVVRNTLVKLITIFMIFAFVKTANDLWKYILLLGVAQVGGNLTLWPYLKDAVCKVPISQLRPFKHFYPAFLLFIPTITTQVYLVVNRLMLGRMAAPSDLGNFTYADRLVKLILALATATGSVMLPNVAKKFADHDIAGVRNSLYDSFDFVSAISFPMMFGLMAIAEKFAPWFLGDQYLNTGQIMVIESPIIVFIAWSTVTGNQYLMPVNRIREYTTSVTVGAIINVIANFFLIHLYAANGAAMATVISEFCVTAYQLHAIRTTIKRRKLFSATWKYFGSALAMYFVVHSLNQIMNMTIVNLAAQIAIGAVIYIVVLIFIKAPVVGQAKKLLKKVDR